MIMDFSNTYNIHLDIPVPFIAKVPDHDPSERVQICVLNEQLINPEWIKWLKSLGFYINHSRWFYTNKITYNLHIDNSSVVPNRFAKINYVHGGKDSYMAWYRLKAGREPFFYSDKHGDRVMGFRQEDCIELYRSAIASPSLIDAGTIHTLVNPHDVRTCFSMSLWDIKGRRPVGFSEAADRLSSFFA